MISNLILRENQLGYKKGGSIENEELNQRCKNVSYQKYNLICEAKWSDK